jgi:hypothetical protein
MSNYILEITNISKINEKRYSVEIAFVDTVNNIETHYTTIEVEAINQEFAKKIAEIRIEEMLSDTTEHDLFYSNNLKETCKDYVIVYNDLQERLSEIQEEFDDILAEIIGKYQKSSDVENINAELGIDIKSLNINAEMDGEQMSIWAIRLFIDGDSQWLELKASSTGNLDDLCWYTIYDFPPETTYKILSAIMENI